MEQECREMTVTFHGISVQFNHSVLSNSLLPYVLQQARLPRPLPAPRAYSNSVHRVSDAIQPPHSLSASSCLQSFPVSGSFLVSEFASGGIGISVSASSSALPMNIQD